MNTTLSKDTAHIIILILLVSALPISFYLPGVPTFLLMGMSIVLSSIVYIVHLLGKLKTNAEKTTQMVNDLPGMKAEPKTIQEILNRKLESGIIEQAIDKQFDKMVDNMVNDLFGNYGDISGQMKKKLKEQMNPYIEEFDFSQHNIKLEMVMNELVTQVTKEQTQIISNTRTLMGLNPVAHITSSELFDKFCDYIGEEIETDKLEIDTDDTPSYQHLTASLETQEERSYSKNSERKTLLFHCVEDEKLDVAVTLHRWKDMRDDNWHIWSVSRPNKDSDRLLPIDEGNIVALANPVSYMRQMDELEIFLVKLNQDRTAIELDEESIEDDEVEVQAEPEYTIS